MALTLVGALIFDFADGAQPTMPPHDTYEAWELLDVREDEDDPAARTPR